MCMWLKIKFEDPLTINVNVSITQKQDERVAQLEKQMDDWLAALKPTIEKLNVVSEQVDSKNSL